MKLESNSDFEVLGFSDSRYKRLTAEIQYKGEPIAQVNQDKGVDALEVEIFADLSSATLRVPFSGFFEAMILAKNFIVESG
ncbi:hypothetical protein CRN80_15550 [Pseudomonas sp. FDAARGOS_380]|uniref:hypothetical protein n=1 Tax=unclassified Pseudomonas TaxID=196821 RepID=UPI000BFD94FD|nr:MULTISPECIES: hypothetical protein [unclassified Pseudomonas]ATN10976.1 hypothetical protein CRN80_15550 [Pseudomonas sp. FDAARGOS_380]NMX29522.1 hypothetical protein [Pseudomonas sp. WS 5406]